MRSLQSNHKPKEHPSHVPRNCNPSRNQCKKTSSLRLSTSLPTLGSTTTNNLSLDGELVQLLGKAATVLSKLGVGKEAAYSKYQGCCVQSLHHQHPLFGSESWTSYAAQECKLNVFHHRCLRQVLGVSWQDKVTNYEVLDRAGIPSMYTLLHQRHLDMYIGWRTDASQKTCCMVSWPQGTETLVVPNFITKTSASVRWWPYNWRTPTGNPWQTTGRLRCLVCVCHFCFSFGYDVWYVFAIFVSLERWVHFPGIGKLLLRYLV